MKKENKIILFISIIIIINCFIVVVFSTEINKRNTVATKEREKISREIVKNSKNTDDISEDSDKIGSILDDIIDSNVSESDKEKNIDNQKELKEENDKRSNIETSGEENTKIKDQKQKGKNDDKNNSVDKKDVNGSTKKNIKGLEDLNKADGYMTKVINSLEKLKNLSSSNKDVVGYLLIENTKIDTPVVEDDSFDFYKDNNMHDKYAKIDYLTTNRKKLLDETSGYNNTIIYGVNESSKSVFSELTKYKEEEFFNAHPDLYYINDNRISSWKVFSVYYINGDNEQIRASFHNDKNYIRYLTQIQSRSLYSEQVALNKDSKILTLYTDSFEYPNAKTVVHAVLKD